MSNHPPSQIAPTAPSGRRMTDALARRYLARVIVHARRMTRRVPSHIALNDLISAGLLGRAVRAANHPGGPPDDSLARALGVSLAEFRSRVAHVQAAVTGPALGVRARRAACPYPP